MAHLIMRDNRSSSGVSIWQLTSATNVYEATFDRNVQLLWAHIEYISSAVAGQRWIRFGLLNPSGVEIADFHSGVKQAGSLTRHYNFMQGVYRETSFNDNELLVPIPMDFIILSGFKIHIEDVANISATDSMLITLQTKVIH